VETYQCSGKLRRGPYVGGMVQWPFGEAYSWW